MKTEECLALAEWEVTVRSLLLDRHYLWLNFFSCLIVVKNNQLPIIFLKSCKFHVLHLFVTSHLTQKALSEYIIKTNNVLLKQNSNKKPVTLLCHCWSIISPLQVSKSIHIIIYKLISKLSDSYHDKKKKLFMKASNGQSQRSCWPAVCLRESCSEYSTAGLRKQAIR